MVLLGLKPVGAFLSRVMREYWAYKDDDINSTFIKRGMKLYGSALWCLASRVNEQTSVRTMIDLDKGYIWNPEMVNEVSRTNPELFKKLSKEQQTIYSGNFYYSDREFSRFMDMLNRENHMQLEAALFGYPLIAAQLFEQYHELMITQAKDLWGTAQANGQTLECEVPHSPLDLETNVNNCRDEFIRLANIYGCDTKLLYYVQFMHPAHVPGYKYTTLPGLTTKDEEMQRHIFDSLNIQGWLNVSQRRVS